MKNAVTEEGIVICFNDEHPKKEEFPIYNIKLVLSGCTKICEIKAKFFLIFFERKEKTIIQFHSIFQR